MGLERTPTGRDGPPAAPLGLRFAVSRAPVDVDAAQRLRHRVFVEEMGALSPRPDGLEADAFDPVSEHLILTDPARPEAGVVATMRLGRGERGYYTAGEFDIAPLLASGKRIVEMGRTCLHPDYRGGAAAYALFRGMRDHLRETGAQIVFGAASFPGADPAPHLDALRLLRARHLAPEAMRPRAIGTEALDTRGPAEPEAMRGVPPLLRAYLRAGARVGEGAWIDRRFNTVDVCMVLDLARATPGGARP